MRIHDLSDLTGALAQRELSLSIHNGAHGWIVWLFPMDDPEQIIVVAHIDLGTSIAQALRQWDRGEEDN